MENLEVVDAGAAPAGNVEMFQGELSAEAPQVESVPNVDLNPVTGQEVAEPISQTTENGVDQKGDTDRYEYWQSQADKAKSELSGLREELDYYKSGLQPVEQMIRQNPEVLQSLETKLSNGQPVEQTQMGVQQSSLKEPIEPEKPVNYNEVDAYNDPESKSFQYRMSKENYRDDYLGYLKDVDVQRESNMQAAYQKQNAIQQEQSMKQQAYSHAVNSYGWDNQKAGQFIQWASAPDNLSMDNLAKLFELRTNANPVVQQKTQEMQNQAQRLSVPRDPSVITGKSEQPRSEEQSFSDALLGR
jgi:hypothetical protein|tara:strand:- start:2991 stop:3893 length:903 start_codon:yes stop_codon:yes gene_type:complete